MAAMMLRLPHGICSMLKRFPKRASLRRRSPVFVSLARSRTRRQCLWNSCRDALQTAMQLSCTAASRNVKPFSLHVMKPDGEERGAWSGSHTTVHALKPEHAVDAHQRLPAGC